LFAVVEIVRTPRMKSKMMLALIFIVLAWLTLKCITPAEAQPAGSAQLQHGEYLVERVGMCADCHTPRNLLGVLERRHWLQGAKLEIKPVHSVPFATMAPPIAGLPTFPNDELAVRFLETGTNVAGRLAMQPMPQFRFNHEDAVAVVAYLRSLQH
jgi:mono/diheme cytochrome c family protein